MPIFGPPNVEKLQAKGTVKGLIKALSYMQDASVREKSAKALGEIGDEQAVEPLSVALKDSDTSVRLAAAGALGEIGVGDERALRALIDALEDSEIDDKEAIANAVAQIFDRTKRWSTRRAAMALIEIDDSRGVDLLVGELEPLLEMVDSGYFHGKVNRNSERNMNAVEALVGIGDSRAVEPLAGYLSIYPREKDKTKVAWALGEIGDPAARDALIEALKDDGHSVRFEAAEALFKLGLVPEEVEDQVRYHIAREDVSACVELGKPAADALFKMLGYHDRSDFPLVARALAEIGDPRAVKPLLAGFEVIFKDSNPQEFDALVDALVAIGEPAVDELIAALDRIDDPYDLKKIHPAQGAACALVRMGETRAIEPLIRILQYGGVAQSIASDSLAEFGSLAVERMLIALDDRPSTKTTHGIGLALGRIEDKETIRPLISILRHQSETARKGAARSLERLTGEKYGTDYVRWEEWWDSQEK